MNKCKYQACKGYYDDCNEDEYICLNGNNRAKESNGEEREPMTKCNKTEDCGYEEV